MDLLVIEDDRHVRSLVTDLFEHDGFAVDAVANVADALTALSGWRYDLVILDLLLPDGTGAAVLQQLREGGSTTPVVICSGLSETGLRTAMFDHGADAVLAKPFSCTELQARVRALLRRRPEHQSGEDAAAR